MMASEAETTVQAKDGAPGRRGGLPRVWLLLIAIAALPFLLRLNLDLRQTDLQTVQGLYRLWRWSPEGRTLKSGATVVFRQHDEKSVAEDFFKQQLQKDFKVVDFGEFPRLQAYFETGDRLRARVELTPPGPSGAAVPLAWQGETRVADNGLLLGPWLGSMLVVMGKAPWVGAVTAAAVIALWDADWSPLDVPARLVDSARGFAEEIRVRAARGDWTSSEMGRVPMIALLVWLLPSILIWSRWHTRSARAMGGFILFSLALEPLALWTSELFGRWDPNASWWKVYLGSFAYRFVLFAFAVFLYFRRRGVWAELRQARMRHPLAWLLLPAVFVLANGWDWLSAAVVPGTGETLLRLRIFLVGWLLAYSLGSRVFSLWLGTFALAVHVPPTSGHWNASALYGLLADGLLLGWWMTPLRGGGVGRPSLPFGGRGAVVLAAIGWTVGVLLSSVGVPLGVCWLTLVAAVWGYAQVLPPSAREAS